MGDFIQFPNVIDGTNFFNKYNKESDQGAVVVTGINWGLRAFDPRQSIGYEVAPKKFEIPKPLKPEKKKAVIFEVMPEESLPKNCPDYRPLLQRDGLILFSWEIYGEEIKVVWLTSNRGMYKYQALTDDEGDLPSLCPKKKYESNRQTYFQDGHCYHTETVPDFIVYTCPPGITANTRNAFIARLKAAGVLINFDYIFTLGKQKAAGELAVADRINNQNYLTFYEAELLEVYRQLDDISKPVFIQHLNNLLSEQEKEGKA
jgi:hypothetical protein